MITPAYSITASERVLPSMMLDFTTASLDARVSLSRALNTATTVNSSGYIAAVSANLPRFWYDPITKVCKGLLIEESRDNLLSYSDTFSNVVWTTSGGILSSDTTVSPDNTQNADTIATTSANGAITRAIGITANANTYCCTVFVKYLSGATNFRLRVALTGGTAVAAHVAINASTGAFVSSSAGAVYTIEPYANGFWRISILAANNSTNTSLNYQIFSTNDAVATNSMAVYGAQAEVGAFPTSYIPTTTTSLTRNADVVSMTGTNFSSWYNATEGTVSAEVQPIASITAGYPRILSITDNTNSNEISLAYDNATPAVYAVVRTSNTNVAVLPKNITAGDRTASIVVVGAYKTNSFAATTKGLSPATGTSGNLPTVNRMNIGCGPIDTGSAFVNAWLSKISYWPQRLINNEVQAFSKR